MSKNNYVMKVQAKTRELEHKNNCNPHIEYSEIILSGYKSINYWDNLQLIYHRQEQLREACIIPMHKDQS